ncbi:acyltransferase domain-containing protein [Streptomyces sp. NBC_01298]|uniref:acyltransferase domain-containing protein n=1 Tax=Streptomyces sp. NBC_01298 TaxID=2903817 RepID=UPI002E11EF77|nr:acyltransferase domain-containing protein [Streptomyces sp. NBC_01298]
MTDIAIIGLGRRFPGVPGVPGSPGVPGVPCIPGHRASVDRPDAPHHVVGGVHLGLAPGSPLGSSGLLAPSGTGVRHPFDAEARGFVLGEGAGVLVLRPLAEALAAGHRVYAVLPGAGPADDDLALCHLASGTAPIGHPLSAAAVAGLLTSAPVLPRRAVVLGPATTPHPARFPESARFPEPAAGPARFPDRATDTGSTGDRATDTGSTGGAHGTEGVPGTGRPQLVFLSAGNPELLDQYIGELLDVLDAADRTPLAALAHALGARAPRVARLAIVATDTAGLLLRLRHARAQLLAGARGDLGDGAFAADAPLPAAQRRTAFLFPGRGSQRPDMMRDLYARFPAYRSAVCVLSAVARADLGFDLADLLYGEASAYRTSQTSGVSHVFPVDNGELGRRLAASEVCLPLLGTVQIAATRVLADCGISPDLVLGHDSGEFAAAAAAGALTHVDAVRLLVHRGAALRRAATGLRAEEALRPGLATRRIAVPAVPFVSSVNAEVCTDPERLRALWIRQASAPVRFDDAVRTAYGQGARVFLQVAGGDSLLAAVRRILPGHGDVHLVPVTGEVPDDGRSFVLALARLAVLGAPVDPRAVVPARERGLPDRPV